MRRLIVSIALFLTIVPPALARPLVEPPFPHKDKPVAAKKDRTAPQITELSVSNGGAPWEGDTPRFTTISPNDDEVRDTAAIRFFLSEPAHITIVLARTRRYTEPIYSAHYRLDRGWRTLYWDPELPIEPNSYLVQLFAIDKAGNRSKLAPNSIREMRRKPSAVVRVLGVDAGFTKVSYKPEDFAVMNIESDASSLELQFFHVGPETDTGRSEMKMYGVPVGEPVQLDWKWQDRRHSIRLQVGPWDTGVYYVQLTADDGRVGYAPFVLRPQTIGWNRIAVVLPAYTWQAYNFRDENQDGFGDTWYAGPPMESARLGRIQLSYGAPPHFGRYELAFLRWLHWTNQNVDYIADSDLETIRTGDGLAERYNLMVWPSHTEYETMHVFEITERYRDLGGKLIFLSANNFFWKVTIDKEGVMHRNRKFRTIGHPEAAVLGVGYLANDRGQSRPPYLVQNVDAAPWFWEGTGLTLGTSFGGNGIEIDHTTADSPPGIIVLAEILDIYGPGVTAQMTYYETDNGAKVFSAGALDFCSTVGRNPQRRMLENLWARFVVP